MADQAQFVIQLVDKMSGPSKSILASISPLPGALDGMSSSMAELGPAGIIAAAAVAGIGAAFAAIGFGADLAIHATEAKQETLAMLDAMLGSQEAAQSTYKAIEGLSGVVAISQKRGMDLARELSAAGVTNQAALVDSIKTIGDVESVLGEGAGGKIQKIIEKASATGQFKLSGKQLVGTGIQESAIEAQLSKQLGVVPAVVKAQLAKGKISAEQGIAALNAVLQGKFAGPAADKVLTISNQFQMLKDNVSKLFEDVKTGPFLEALSKLFGLFDQNTASGKLLKQVVTTVFDKVFALAAKAIPYLVIGLKQMVIWGLKGYIALKTVYNTLRDSGAINLFLKGLKYIAIGFALITAPLLIGTALLLAMGVVMGVVAAAVTAAMGAAVGAIIAGVGWIIGKLGELWDYVSDLASKFYDAGANLIGGLIDGIKAGGSAAVDAVKNIGASALDGFKSVFGIHSPSKVMAQMGGHLMGGLEQGIAGNDNGPQSAMMDSMQPSASPSGGQAAPAMGGGTTTVNIGPGAIVLNINGNTAQEVSAQLKEKLPGELATMFEGLGIAVGAS